MLEALLIYPRTMDIRIDKTAPVIEFSGERSYTVQQAVYIGCTGVCALIRQFMADDQGIANGLYSKLLNAQEAEKRGNLKAKEGILHAFLNQVDAKSGKKLTTEQAQILKKLAGYL
ncbi:hypothetical protein GC098_06175 [Paenibacillus sp. LMG 31458]|uniref:Uncharacterized protein n=1 Tax=Paenibacillus phytorum TaxID=2654977 RepID=A0ABX1XR69_9BACL|nr:hypothetical protein [Paenibacillus phytorum]NOU71021.1 hypothetical protein [Paenibacillus phytorum]